MCLEVDKEEREFDLDNDLEECEDDEDVYLDKFHDPFTTKGW